MIKMQQARFILFIFFLCFAPLAGAQPSLGNAAIASAHPLPTQAGKAILGQGGNAFDTAVAAA
jgi:gamma-glutamyltranspeptidase